MSISKYIFTWYVFFISFVLIFFGVFSILPERWLYFDVVDKIHSGFIEESTWDSIYMLAMCILSLLVNGVFIYLVLTLNRLRKKS